MTGAGERKLPPVVEELIAASIDGCSRLEWASEAQFNRLLIAVAAVRAAWEPCETCHGTRECACADVCYCSKHADCGTCRGSGHKGGF